MLDSICGDDSVMQSAFQDSFMKWLYVNSGVGEQSSEWGGEFMAVNRQDKRTTHFGVQISTSLHCLCSLSEVLLCTVCLVTE